MLGAGNTAGDERERWILCPMELQWKMVVNKQKSSYNYEYGVNDLM